MANMSINFVMFLFTITKYMPMKLNFNLPDVGNLSLSDDCAVNLRQTNSGLVPTGTPATLLPSAGLRNFRLPNGAILSVANDMHSLMLNGAPIGSLASPFGAMIPDGVDGDCIILTTLTPPEWIVGGKLRGSFAPVSGEISLSVASESPLSATVDPLKLSGSYPRATGTLSSSDCQKAYTALSSALSSLEYAAAVANMRVQPAWFAWQILDEGGQIILRSDPVLLQSAAGFQGLQGAEMTLTRSDGKFTACSAGSISASAYSVKLSVRRAAESWRRRRAATLEILAAEPLQYIKGAQGAFNSVDSSTSALFISPLGGDSASLEILKERSRAEFAQKARVVARIANPLEGVEVTVGTEPLTSLTSLTRWSETVAEPRAIAALRSGSAVVYADASTTGMLLCAPASAPLAPIGSARVANGKIHAICTPAGSGGGWNYARQHLLVFAADGVYAVSIDRSLSLITSSLIYPEGVPGADAVARHVNSIFFCTNSGALMNLKGVNCSRLEAPFAVRALAVSKKHSELWLASASGLTATVNPQGKASFRTDLTAIAFHPGQLATDATGALRDLDNEVAPAATDIEWRRRTENPVRSAMTEWLLDSPMFTEMRLSLDADGGGAPQTLMSLTLNGPLNAPLRARLIAPPRPYLTVEIKGKAASGSRFQNLKLK